VNTFHGKYGAIPGDMNIPTATQFGFFIGASCSGARGQRDGNGLIESWNAATGQWTEWQAAGETGLFWQDLSSPAGGGLIDGSFQGSGGIGCIAPGNIVGTALPLYVPSAKIGNGNFVYVYGANGFNWFGIEAMTGMDSNGTPQPYPIMATTISVNQAYSIDKKVDDGVPTTGNVQAAYAAAWTATTVIASAPNAASDSATTCYNTTGPAYSVTFNGGAGANCALSFRFQ
jgi:hypothetical protein